MRDFHDWDDIRAELRDGNDHALKVERARTEAWISDSLREYESLKETAYLLASPANARRLNEAVEELRNGGGEAHDLIHPDARSDETPPG